MLDFLRHHWYDLGVITAAIAIRLGYNERHRISIPQIYLLANFLALIAHQFEEYRFPGGFPAVMNIAVQGNRRNPNQYPLNANAALLTNVSLTYGVYLPSIFYPEAIWFGMTTTIFGFLQFFIHGILINAKMHSVYNPGLLTVLLGHIPIGVQYIRYLRARGALQGRDVVLGIFGAIGLAYGLLLKSSFGWMADLDSPHPFNDDEMHRWGAPARLWS